MFRNMKLGTKIALGFGLLIVMATILGVTGYYSSVCSTRAVDQLGNVLLPSVEAPLVIKQGGTDVKTAQRTLLNPDIEPAVRVRQQEVVSNARATYEQAWKTYEALPQSVEETLLWKEFVPAWEAWGTDNTEFFRLSNELDALNIGNPIRLERDLAQFRGDHYKLEGEVLQMIADKKLFEGGEDHTACRFGKWKQTARLENPEVVALTRDIEEPHRHFHECVKTIKELVKADKPDEARTVLQEQMKPNAQKVFTGFDGIIAVANSATALYDNMNRQGMEACLASQTKANDLLDKIVTINGETAEHAATSATQQAGFFKALSMTAMIIGVVAGVVLAVFITRSITGPIRRIIASLTEGSEQVSSASGQVSAASQSLAEGATEQAAGLEETSSSLEEMSSMTKQNADNAQQANTLAAEAKKAATTGAESMSRMNAAIHESQKSSDETAKIIKVIDEIAAASQEQAQGIDQVNTAVSQMDKVTQQNAANAEESASASEELSTQAERMQEVVSQLVDMVGGAGSQQVSSGRTRPDRHHIHLNLEHTLHSSDKSKSRSFGRSDEVLHKIAGHPEKPQHAKTRSAGTTIPLDGDDDLHHFNN